MPPLPTISIVVPFWNAAPWIERTIASLLRQDQPVEIIAVDDGSTDDGPAIVARFSDRVHCIARANRGVSAARNTGLAAATGDYVVFHDADDYLEGPILAGAARTAAATGADIIVSPSCSERSGGRRQHANGWDRKTPRQIALDVANGRTSAVHAFAFRRAYIVAQGGFREDVTYSEDAELVLRCILGGATMATSDAGLAVWSVRDGHDGVSTRRDEASLRSAMIWLPDHRELVGDDPPLRLAYGRRAYTAASAAYAAGFPAIGATALAAARSCGLQGHPGGPRHRLLSRLLGLRGKEALARSARRLGLWSARR